MEMISHSPNRSCFTALSTKKYEILISGVAEFFGDGVGNHSGLP